MSDEIKLPSSPLPAQEPAATERPMEITEKWSPPGPDETLREPSTTRPESLGQLARTTRRFGEYELLGEIARGGMGVVFRARHVKLNRVVALKMIRSAGLAQPQDIERFQAEAGAAANLQHPGIVAIYEVGERSGQHYYTMEFVEGQSLADRLAEHPLDPLPAARYAEQIARAIQYAHEKGVLHRDLKPSNVLVDRAGRVRVTDFGLAKRLTGGSHLTATGDVLGTPSFMPPEQATGESARIGPRSDVYSLGALLYALVTGQPPFRAANPAATLLQVIESEAVSPRLVNPAVPVDLETICLKCLDKEPLRRYGSAQDLADDLERFQKGEPVLARPVGRVERAVRWCRRNPALAGAITACVLALLSGTAASTYFGVRAMHQAEEARQQSVRADNEAQAARRAEGTAREQAELATAARTKAEAEKERADTNAGLASERAESLRHSLYVARLNLAGQALREGEIPKVLASLESVRPKEGETDLRGFEWQHYWEATHSAAARFADSDNESYPRRVRFSRDGKRLYAAQSTNVKVYNLPQGTIAAMLPGHSGRTNDFVLLPESDLLVSAAGHEQAPGQILLWNLTEHKQLTALRSEGDPVMCLAASPDGKTLLAGTAQLGFGFTGPSQRFGAVKKGSDGAILVFDLAERKLVETLTQPAAGVVSLAFSPSGSQFAAGCSDGVVRVWEWPDRKLRHELTGHGSNVWRVAYSPDGKLLAAAAGQFNTSGSARLWNAEAGREIGQIMNHTGGVFDVAFSPTSKRLATAGWDNTIQLWDATGDEPVWLGTILGHASHVLALDFSPDGSQLASGAEAGKATLDSDTARADTLDYRLWDVDRHVQVYPTQLGEPPAIKGVAVPLFDKHANRAQLMDFNTGEIQGWGRCSVALGTGRYARLGADGQSVVAVDLLSGREVTLAFPQEGLKSVHFAGPGEILIGLGSSYAVVWDVATGKSLVEIPCGATVRTRLSYDGSVLATQGEGKEEPPTYWRIPTGETIAKPPADLANWFTAPTGYRGRPILYSWLSDDGRFRTLSTREALGSLTVFDLRKGWEHGFQASERWVRGVDVTADGRLMAVCGYDYKADLWNLETREHVARFDSGQSPCLALSPDGKLLATGGDDTVVRLWNLQTLKEEFTLRGHTEVIWHVAFSPDGRRLVSTGWDRAVKLWDVQAGQMLASFSTPRQETWQSYFSADGRLLLTFDKDSLTVRRAAALGP